MSATRSMVGMLCAALLLALLGVAVTGPASAQPDTAAEVELASGTCVRDPQLANQFPDVADDSVFGVLQRHRLDGSRGHHHRPC